jgi:hypothetical protein
MISGVPKYFLIRPNTEKKRTGKKEYKRIIAIGNFMGVLWSSCGMLWKQSLKNEV